MNSSNQQTPNILENLVLRLQSAEKIRGQQNISSSFPLDSLPPILKNVVTSLHFDTQIPVELICQVVLAAASLACQSIVNVKPHSCLLLRRYLLVLGLAIFLENDMLKALKKAYSS